jgi:two-component system NtrC family response regulator/two-component system response regulator HydG
MVKVFQLIRSVAATSSTVLLQGESGTGKELVAKALHSLSPRRDATFVSVNCAAMPEALLESELFGHMRGAFTDAHQTKKGLFETAHRGTLLLDEVGEMPLPMQAKLLRVLQEKRVRRVGANDEVDVDVRVVAATNRSLEALVQERRFREDLFYRLNVIPIVVPPLRQRREDIPLLAAHFLGRFSREMGKTISKISEEAMERLLHHSWPGNVRELENAMERAVVLAEEPLLNADHFPTLRAAALASGNVPERPTGLAIPGCTMAELEREAILRTMESVGGSTSRAAEILQISPRKIQYKLKEYHQEGAVARTRT